VWHITSVVYVHVVYHSLLCLYFTRFVFQWDRNSRPRQCCSCRDHHVDWGPWGKFSCCCTAFIESSPPDVLVLLRVSSEWKCAKVRSIVVIPPLYYIYCHDWITSFFALKMLTKWNLHLTLFKVYFLFLQIFILRNSLLNYWEKFTSTLKEEKKIVYS